MSDMLGKHGRWPWGCTCGYCARHVTKPHKAGRIMRRTGRAREKRTTARNIAEQAAILDTDPIDPICPVSGEICDDCMEC